MLFGTRTYFSRGALPNIGKCQPKQNSKLIFVEPNRIFKELSPVFNDLIKTLLVQHKLIVGVVWN